MKGETIMATVDIVMGSDSDLKVMAKAAEFLDEMAVSYDMRILSAHREPENFFLWAKDAEERGTKVIIAGAGMAAHLPGMCAAISGLPVIGIPLSSKVLDGVDALYAILQMPPGVPVATMSLDGAKNGAIMAVEMLAMGDETLKAKLKAYRQTMKDGVMKKDAKLQAIGYRAYIR